MSQFKKLQAINEKTSGGTFDFQTGKSDNNKLLHLSLYKNDAFATNDDYLIATNAGRRVPPNNMNVDRTFYMYSSNAGDTMDGLLTGRKADGTFVTERVKLTGQVTKPTALQFMYLVNVQFDLKGLGVVSFSTKDDQVAGVSVDNDEDVGVMRIGYGRIDPMWFQCLPNEKLSLQSLRVHHSAINSMLVSVGSRTAGLVGNQNKYLELVCPPNLTHTFDLSLVPAFSKLDLLDPYVQVWIAAREIGGPTATPDFKCDVSAIIS